MEGSSAECSANHFGVKLRKVSDDSSGSNEIICTEPGDRRSLPAGIPNNCETRANQRRSANASSSQVALRQEMAEKQAIQRRKKSSSRSWEKKSKPLIPPKPVVLKSSSSLGNIPKSTSSVTRKSSVVQRKSPLVVPVPVQMPSEDKKTETADTDTYTSWMSSVYEAYEQYKPALEALCVHVKAAMDQQAKIVHQIYIDYRREFNREARQWRNSRLQRRLKHGHSFLTVGVPQPTWCDLCTRTVWGRCTVCLQCVNCKFKCHQNCEDLIHDQCTGPKTEPVDTDCWATSKHLRHDADDADSGYSGSGGSAGFTLTKEEICSKIDAYNKSVGKSTGAMTLPSDVDDSFQGCIKVCVCIDRPINMSLSSRPTSIYEVLHRESELSPPSSPHNTVTHEQLPKNAVVSLHTNSSNTASEVVTILLNKFKITDNPKSFALFEQTIQNEKEVKLRKVGDQERPLLNYLRWITECNESKRFVLKENDSGDIMYEAFSIPELNNFLRVLEQEEATKLTDIQNKYQVRRKQLADRLRELDLERSTDRRSLTTAR